ncbi:MAG TPA: tetratricopeptide repeat protein [Lacunisphaera sp.]
MTSPPAQSTTSPRQILLATLTIVAGAALAYHNTFSVPFLFDDNSSISGNPSIRGLITAWSPPVEGGHTVSGRPFLNFTLALNYAAHGTAVWGYHLLNLLIHVAAGCTLFGIVRRTLCRLPAGGQRGARARHLQEDATWLALAAALLWTLHPLQTQAVTYIIQRAESLVSLLYLLTLWGFIRSVEPGASKGWSVLAWVACLLGMATKEVMVTAPVVVALYDRIFVAGSWRELWARRKGFHLSLALTWLLLAWLVMSTAGRGGTAGFGGGMSPWDYALTQVGAIVHYLRLTLWPSPLVFDYGKDLVAGWGDVWWQALVLFPLGLASLWAAGRGRAAGWLGVFFFAALAPSSSFVPVVTQTMSEHRVYLALAAVVTLMVVGLYAVLGRKSFVGFAILAIGLAAATMRRNHDYRTELAIWEDTVVKRPANVRALAALGSIHQEAGRLDEARVLLQEAVRLAPQSVEARNNLGNAWMKAGRWTEAMTCFEDALRLKPDEPYALNNLGNALLQLGRGTEAIARFEAALRVKPDFPEPRFNLANTLAQAGRTAEALTHYDFYLRMKPDDIEARSNYAATLQMTRRFGDAVTQLEFAVKLRPADAELQNNLGAALAQAGRPADALRHFEEALRLRPDFVQARENLERAKKSSGR